LKIIIIGTAYPLKGGLASFNERLAKALNSEKDIEVELYTFSLQYPSFLFPGKTQYSDDLKPQNLKINIKINSINPLNWIKVGREISNLKPDLILIKYWLPFMGPCFGTILRQVKKNKHTKVISILDNVVPHEKRPGDRVFTKYFLKPVDSFISMSHEVLRDLRTYEPEKPALYSPHPVYDNYGDLINKQKAKKMLGISNVEKAILFFGFIRKYKGLDILLDAMSDERIKEMGVKLIIAGEYYGDKEFYEQKINDLNLQDQLILHTDFISNDEVDVYFSAADCVVQPYRSATQSGISQIAYHFEKPMIVTNVGGLPEIVPNEKVGFVTEVNSKAIADAILRFYKEEKELEFIENIKVEKQQYQWSYFVENIFKMYQESH